MKPAQIQDFYERLGVARDASPEEIKKSYRKMALSWHPDRSKSPEADEQFRAVSEAYGILSDLRKKLLYDMFHPSAVKPESPKQEPKADKIRSSALEDLVKDVADSPFNHQKKTYEPYCHSVYSREGVKHSYCNKIVYNADLYV